MIPFSRIVLMLCIVFVLSGYSDSLSPEKRETIVETETIENNTDSASFYCEAQLEGRRQSRQSSTQL